METFPHFEEVAPAEASVFRMRIREAKKANPKGAAVDVHKLSDYKDMKMYMTRDGKAGYAVKPTGELTSVFKHPEAKYEAVGQRAAEHATLMAGATHLSAFEPLPNLYSRGGAEVTGRTKWNDAYKPRGWSYKNMGRPDVAYASLGGKTGTSPAPTTGGAYNDDYDTQMGQAQREGERRTAPIQRAMRRLGAFLDGHNGAKSQ